VLRFNRICVVAHGYIRLPTSAVFADNSVDVLSVDSNRTAVDKTNRGGPHFVEPNPDVLLREAVQAGRRPAAPEAGAADAFIIVVVPTPFGQRRQPNLTYIEAAAGDIAPHLAAGNLVIPLDRRPRGGAGKG
jgi:UDP-N-acetyl-D-mannosaminuronic acid dehydrogenase